MVILIGDQVLVGTVEWVVQWQFADFRGKNKRSSICHTDRARIEPRGGRVEIVPVAVLSDAP